MAQRDAAFLSYNIHLCFLGSLDPLTQKIVLLFFPDYTDFPELESDAYSEKLAEIVFNRYLVHYQNEENNPHTFPSSCWKPDTPQIVAHVAQWIPWVEPLPQMQKPIPITDKKGWAQQVAELREMREDLNDQKLEIIYQWAGERGLGHHWRILANKFLHNIRAPFAKVLLVRSILMMGLYDGMIKELAIKYTFCSPRPTQEELTMPPILPDPMTPGYPSGHATQGSIVTTILTHYFPDSGQYWTQLENEAALSRIWAGVHFPQDIEGGKKLGKIIGNQVIESVRNQK